MIFIALGLFVGLIVVHELGHFLAARRNGVEVEEFGLGFPPRLYGRRFGKDPTLYSINWLPMGGFVKLKGEHESDKEPGSYGAASFKTKTLIILAGVGMNLAAAVVLLGVLSVTGLPKLDVGGELFKVSGDTETVRQDVFVSFVGSGGSFEASGIPLGAELKTIDGVAVESSEQVVTLIDERRGKVVGVAYQEPESTEIKSTSLSIPDNTVNSYLKVEINDQLKVIETLAGQEDLMPGDKLLEINNESVSSLADLSRVSARYAGESVELKINRGGNEQLVMTSLSDAGFQGLSGFSPGDLVIERSTWSAPLRGLVLTGQFSWLVLQGLGQTLGQLFSGDTAAAAENVAGPVGIVVLLSDLSSVGLEFVIYFIALISITLAVMNALPIPALDGGRLFVSGLYKFVLKRPLNARVEERIHATGMMVLLALIALITFVDVNRFF